MVEKFRFLIEIVFGTDQIGHEGHGRIINYRIITRVSQLSLLFFGEVVQLTVGRWTLNVDRGSPASGDLSNWSRQ